MKRKNNKKNVYVILAVLATLAVAVIAWFSLSGSDSEEKKVEQTNQSASLTYGFGGDPVSLNPINSNDLWGLKTINMIYSPLARTNNDGTVTNELAKSIRQTEDGKTIIVKLRKDVKWS